MLSVVSLVGRPNVGKSTLFNRLTRSRDALVDDQPGVTRDRLYGKCHIGNAPFLVVDTGGLEAEDSAFSSAIREQVNHVIEESDVVVFLVDGGEGIVNQDREIAQILRVSGVRVVTVVNKSEGQEANSVAAEFQELALGDSISVSARRGDGIQKLVEYLENYINPNATLAEDQTEMPIISIVGRPNVGKSTLTNKLSGESRVIVSDVPGTTRDSVTVPILIDGKQLQLIDTAGVRKKSKVSEAIEKFSIVKTLLAVESSHVVLLVLDAHVGVSAQDASIAGMIDDLGRSIVIVLNKWDGLDSKTRATAVQAIETKLGFLPNPEIINISALHGSRVKEIIPALLRAYKSAIVEIATSSLNRTLQDAVIQTPPPTHNRRPIRLKFAHQGGKCPPLVVVHGNQCEKLPKSYERYLSKYFARTYRLFGTRVRILAKQGQNPYHDRG